MTEEKRDISCREAGARGGKRTAEKHGLAGAQARGRKGGATTKARHDTAHFQRIGKMGADKLKALVAAGKKAQKEEVNE